MEFYTHKGKVVEVYDGDTITIEVDLGFYTKVTEKFRLMYINAPEIRGEQKPQGLISKQWLVDKVLNKNIIVKTTKDRKEKYGRYLAEIFLLNDTISLNQQMINEGLAIPYMD